MINTGQQAEQIALDHLLAEGLTLLERNYRRRLGEIDIVMTDSNRVVFVEVRYRRTSRYGDGLASVTRTKQQKLAGTARAYLSHHRVLAKQPCRFDVVAITGALEAPEIRWVRNAFDV